MRFARLALERYGRFEDCELSFRPGGPDLHVVYGANEAGKTTSMAAVSDLLFGFGTTSPYNFVFDYSLLRVGAELEEDGHSLLVRRRKANSGSLVGADDKAIDETPLLAMLRGQTRETFRLSFSLDQEGLRRGGRAMVQAKDDLGQALFAAGSNLTGVTSVLESLEEESSAIWGKRASARRTYTVAEREYREATRSVREFALKPKEWTDARNAERARRQDQDDLERAREVLAEEGRRLQRLRRLGPFARTRSTLIAELETYASTVALSAQTEALAEEALATANQAERARSAAETLRVEADARLSLMVVDERVLANADRLEELVGERGAAAKASVDLERLKADKDLSGQNLNRLRREAGLVSGEAPGRVTVARLREIAKASTEVRAALRQLVQTEEDLRSRLNELKSGEGTASDDAYLAALRTSVEAARALGDDVDRRCVTASDDAVRADGDAASALDRLGPWIGDAAALSKLVPPSEEELQFAARGLSDAATARDEYVALARRLTGEAEVLQIGIESLQGNEGAVSDDDLAQVRAERDGAWQGIRADIVLGRLGPNAADDASKFEIRLGESDQLADRRYAMAEDSGRLAHLITDRRVRLLQAEQADARSNEVVTQLAKLEEDWTSRLAATGLPDLPPARFRTWLGLRDAALVANVEALRLGDVTRREVDRRDRAVADLLHAIDGRDAEAAHRYELATVLARAVATLADGDAIATRRRDDAAELARIAHDLVILDRRKRGLEKDSGDADTDWTSELAAHSLTFDMAGAEARLGLFDEVRAATDRISEVDGRIAGIERDAKSHVESVNALATELGVPEGTPEQRIDGMRRALLEVRAAQTAREGAEAERERRRIQEDEARADLDAAKATLSTIQAELGVEDLAAIVPAIDASRLVRGLREGIAEAERQIEAEGDAYGLQELLEAWEASDPDEISARCEAVDRELAEINARVSEAAAAHGDARSAFAQLERAPGAAIDAATDAESALAEMAVQAEEYILRRVQAVTLRWAVERYREQHQDPMLTRASGLFSRLTLSRYSGLRVDFESSSPRLLGVSDDGRSIVDLAAMSEGTTDQLFLALRLAALEQSVASGVRLPFLADDLFVNFDNERARAGFEVMAEMACSTQVLFFTHHAHLAQIARDVVGADVHSECSLA